MSVTSHHQRAMRQPRWATRAEAIAYGKVSATTLNDMMQQGVVVAATAANYAWGPFRASRNMSEARKGCLGLKASWAVGPVLEWSCYGSTGQGSKSTRSGRRAILMSD